MRFRQNKSHATYNFIKASLVFSLFSVFSASAAEITLLVAYDNHTQNRFNNNVQAAMQTWVDGVNRVYSKSNVDLQLRLVHTVNHNPAGGDMKQVLNNVRNSQKINNLRNQYNADFVTQVHQKGKCGIGYVSLSKGYAFNVVGPQCGFLTLAHELGHNMGLNHSRKQGNNKGYRYRYGLGYGVNGSFSTVMAYPSAFNARDCQGRFSNPGITCKGVPCGVPMGDQNEAFAAQALNNVKNTISRHRTGSSNNNSNPSNPVSNSGDFGLRYVNNSTAILYHAKKSWSANWNYLCLDSECGAGSLNGNFYEREVPVTLGRNYSIEFKVQDNAAGQCLSGAANVNYSQNGASAGSSCL